MRIENDARAWYELLRRVNYMFGLAVDLSDLRQRSEEMVEAMRGKIRELERELSQYDVKKYIAKVYQNLEETPFLALDDMWERRVGRHLRRSRLIAGCRQQGAAILKPQLDASSNSIGFSARMLKTHRPSTCLMRSSPCAWSLIQEELNEYRHAAETHDLVEVADALSDLMYVVLGTYVSHGLQDLAEALFAEVHRSNMSKLDENGQVIYRADGKVLKSDRWSPPDLVDPGRRKRRRVPANRRAYG